MSLEDELTELRNKTKQLDKKLKELSRRRIDIMSPILKKCSSHRFAISFDDVIVVINGTIIETYKNGKYVDYTDLDSAIFDRMIELIVAEVNDREDAYLTSMIEVSKCEINHIEDRISKLN